MKFEKVDSFLLFGGGSLFADLAVLIQRSGYPIQTVTSKRHFKENLVEHQITLKEFLETHGMETIVSDDVNNDGKVREKINSGTFGISVGAAWIFKKKFISLFSGRMVNSHGARLPQDRGGGGFSWRILRNDRLGFGLIHQIEPGIDTGLIISHKEYLFPHSCRLPIDYQRYSHTQNLELFKTFITEIEAGVDFLTTGQPEYLSTYWPRLSADIHGYINWSWTLTDIETFICAFDEPYMGAITFLNNTKVRLKSCFSTTGDGQFHPFQQGIIYRISERSVFVAVKGGSLIINRVVDETGRDMIPSLRLGDRFYTDANLIDESNKARAIYTPEGLKKQI